MLNYKRVNLVENGYWKWLFVVDIPIKNGDCPVRKLLIYQRIIPQFIANSSPRKPPASPKNCTWKDK